MVKLSYKICSQTLKSIINTLFNIKLSFFSYLTNTSKTQVTITHILKLSNYMSFEVNGYWGPNVSSILHYNDAK